MPLRLDTVTIELYDLAKDPGQVKNLADDPNHAATKASLRSELKRYLVETKDPRALGQDAPWDYYPYYGLRKNKNWEVDSR
jgi:hypothetical protein